jgi:hypothetical protein
MSEYSPTLGTRTKAEHGIDCGLALTMIHECRTYTIHPGQLGWYLKCAVRKGDSMRTDKYRWLVGSWWSEFGMLNRVDHIWGSGLSTLAECTRL